MATEQLLERLPDEYRDALNGKQVLITGGLGFIGSNIAHALVSLGARVTILDALLEPYGGNTFNLTGITDAVELVDGNILDEDLMRRLVGDADAIVHLAAQVGYVDSKQKPFQDLDYNGRGMLMLLEAVREQAPEARLLFSSSRLVYGKIQELPVKETHPTEPLSLYGIHKLLAEKYLAYYEHNFDVQGLAVRLPNPYGPRQQMKHAKYSIVGWFVRQAMEDQAIQIYGDGSQLRDYIYIDDIVDAMLRLLVKGEAGHSYNVGSHEQITFKEMAETVVDVVGSGTTEQIPWPEEYEKNETGDYVADVVKVEAATNWKPHVTLRDGLTEMVAYYTEHKDQYWT